MNNYPKKEYDLWIPLLGNPMDILDPRENSYLCFGGIMSQEFDKTKPYKERLTPKSEGIHITWYGNTTETLDDSDCGFNAVDNLISYTLLNTKATESYSVLRKYLENMGY